MWRARWDSGQRLGPGPVSHLLALPPETSQVASLSLGAPTHNMEVIHGGDDTMWGTA